MKDLKKLIGQKILSITTEIIKVRESGKTDKAIASIWLEGGDILILIAKESDYEPYVQGKLL